MSGLRVLDPGILALVQDRGRPGLALHGVGASGAADRFAHDLAQRLCGNRPDAAGVEVLLGGLRVVALDGAVVAVTGAPVDVRVDGRLQGQQHAFWLAPGAVLALGPVAAGMRCYLGVRGGIAVPEVLGSRSRDTLGGLGPPPLRAGDLLPVGSLGVAPVWLEPVAVPPMRSEVTVLLAAGPYDDLLDAEGWDLLQRRRWTVDPRSDRVGTRLAGEPLPVRVPDLPSFPVVAGCVQVTGAGHPLVLGPDAGVTGGYPVVGVVARPGLDALAQARPGTVVRLRRDS